MYKIVVALIISSLLASGCGKYREAKTGGIYKNQGDFLVLEPSVLSNSGAILFKTASHPILYEYEISGNKIDFFLIHGLDGKPHRTGRDVRRKWYYFGYEQAPSFEYTLSENGNKLIGVDKLSREVCATYGNSILDRSCSYDSETKGVVWEKLDKESELKIRKTLAPYP